MFRRFFGKFAICNKNHSDSTENLSSSLSRDYEDLSYSIHTYDNLHSQNNNILYTEPEYDSVQPVEYTEVDADYDIEVSSISDNDNDNDNDTIERKKEKTPRYSQVNKTGLTYNITEGYINELLKLSFDNKVKLFNLLNLYINDYKSSIKVLIDTQFYFIYKLELNNIKTREDEIQYNCLINENKKAGKALINFLNKQKKTKYRLIFKNFIHNC